MIKVIVGLKSLEKDVEKICKQKHANKNIRC